MAPERGERPLPGGTEGLPRAFLQSLRTLFDILDDRQRGHVHLREIESRWRGAEARELPAGVMEGLRRAAPPSGFLTFEQFVLGLRAALPGAEPAAGTGDRRRTEEVPSLRGAEERRGRSGGRGGGQREPGHGQPYGPDGDAKAAVQSPGDGSHPGAGDTRRHQRGRAEHRRHTITNGVDFSVHPILSEMPSIPTPSRDGDVPLLCGMLPLPPVTVLTNKADGSRAGQTVMGCSPGWVGVLASYNTFFIPLSNNLCSTKALRFFLWLKYMKELEQEKDVLLQGLELVERAREWYHQHIQLMQERQRLLGKNKTSAEFLPEVGQSHLGRLVLKLQQVNRCLGDLLSTAGKPANPSSALSRLVPAASPASAGSQQAINMLKEQNRLLTKEVTDKSERITQLEQEKSALIKQLFEARAHNNHETSQLDSTFI